MECGRARQQLPGPYPSSGCLSLAFLMPPREPYRRSPWPAAQRTAENHSRPSLHVLTPAQVLITVLPLIPQAAS